MQDVKPISPEVFEQQQDELTLSHFERALKLTGIVPASIKMPNGTQGFLTEGEKTAIVSYAFIGLSELVSVSSGQPMSVIWTACIERAISNLKKEGLLQ